MVVTWLASTMSVIDFGRLPAKIPFFCFSYPLVNTRQSMNIQIKNPCEFTIARWIGAFSPSDVYSLFPAARHILIISIYPSDKNFINLSLNNSGHESVIRSRSRHHQIRLWHTLRANGSPNQSFSGSLTDNLLHHVSCSGFSLIKKLGSPIVGAPKVKDRPIRSSFMVR